MTERAMPGTNTFPSKAVPRLALSRAEAAEALSVSLDAFADHVEPELRMVRVGRRRVVAVAELERFLTRQASLPVGGSTNSTRGAS